jgi:ribonuclease G
LTVHPYLYAYFTKGFISKRVKWFFKYKRWIGIVQDSSLGLTEYEFMNKMGEVIEV